MALTPAENLLLASLSTPLQRISWQPFDTRGVALYLKREDKVDSACSGNKYYKLYHHLEQARQSGYRQLLSFGGAYSNHLHALAAAGQRFQLATIGVVRGDADRPLSPTLEDARRWGMRLHFLSRSEYRLKDDPALLARLQSRFGRSYVIPEGGGGMLGALGCQAISNSIIQSSNVPVNVVCVPCGTGTTLAGIAAALPPGIKAVGISVLKGEGDMQQRINTTLKQLGVVDANWQLYNEFHCGGYAKLPDYLHRFIQVFESETTVPLDPVYTAKMLWGLTKLVERSVFPTGSSVVAIHTGGLQGRRGYQLPIAPTNSDIEPKKG